MLSFALHDLKQGYTRLLELDESKPGATLEVFDYTFNAKSGIDGGSLAVKVPMPYMTGSDSYTLSNIPSQCGVSVTDVDTELVLFYGIVDTLEMDYKENFITINCSSIGAVFKRSYANILMPAGLYRHDTSTPYKKTYYADSKIGIISALLYDGNRWQFDASYPEIKIMPDFFTPSQTSGTYQKTVYFPDLTPTYDLVKEYEDNLGVPPYIITGAWGVDAAGDRKMVADCVELTRSTGRVYSGELLDMSPVTIDGSQVFYSGGAAMFFQSDDGIERMLQSLYMRTDKPALINYSKFNYFMQTSVLNQYYNENRAKYRPPYSMNVTMDYETWRRKGLGLGGMLYVGINGAQGLNAFFMLVEEITYTPDKVEVSSSTVIDAGQAPSYNEAYDAISTLCGTSGSVVSAIKAMRIEQENAYKTRKA